MRQSASSITASNRMLKKSTSGVLASFPRTVKRETRVSLGAVALLDGLFEHPAGCSPVDLTVYASEIQGTPLCSNPQTLPGTAVRFEVAMLWHDHKPTQLGGTVQGKVSSVHGEDSPDPLTFRHRHQCRIGQIHGQHLILFHQVSHAAMIISFHG